MRRSMRLKALALRSGVAALVASLLGGLLQLSPQPVTDLLLRLDLCPEASRQVLLVAVGPEATPGAWIRLAAQLREGGAAAVALVSDGLPDVREPGLVQLQDPAQALAEAGFQTDWDGRHRRWVPALGGAPTLPVRLLEAAGMTAPKVAQRIPIQSAGVPTLDASQVSGLAPAALQGRLVVVGSLDPWATPELVAPGLPIALSEAVARVAAGPDLALPAPPLAGLCAGLVALGATFALLLLRTQVLRLAVLVGVALACVLASALLLRAGAVLPAEVLLAGVATAGFAWSASSFQNVELQVQQLQDRLLARLGEGLGLAEPSMDAVWRDLCRAATSWGNARAAWVFLRRAGQLQLRAKAGAVEGLAPERLLPLLAGQANAAVGEPVELNTRGDPEISAEGPLLAVPLRWQTRAVGVLLLRMPPAAADPGAPEEQAAAARRTLQVFAGYAASRLLNARTREAVRAVIHEQGLRARMHELGASIEQLLDQRDLLLASTQDSRTSHALYDPLGHPLLLDEGFRQVLDRVGLPPESDLPAVWAGLSLPPSALLGLYAAPGPIRLALEQPGLGLDCWAHACTYQNQVLGVGIELVDVSDLQAQDTVKSGLLEMVSYRVHNILAAIRGYADLLALGAVQPGEVAPRIAARCGEMAEIFDRYEDVARSAEGGAPEPIQVIDLLQEVVAGARRNLGEHRVRLVNTPVALAPALAHRNDLARALMSLIHELARDVTAGQAVLVELQAPAGAVEILVRTEGHAPSLPLLQQLAADPRGQGSALAQRLLRAMGGSFVVEGGGERGARYRLQLPEA